MTEVATVHDARARAARIRTGIGVYLSTLTDVATAYAQRDWVALDYESWEAYVDGEYSEQRLKLSPEHRQKAVAELRLSGMSQRAIGTVLGVGVGTVNRVLSGVPDGTPGAEANDPAAHVSGVQNRTPEAKVQGADGKKYAATQPARPENRHAGAESTPESDETEAESEVDAACEACGDPMDAGQHESGFMRCDACDGEESHVSAGFPNGRDGGCATCAEEAKPDETPMPAGQEDADAILAALDRAAPADERPRPPKWDPEERRRHEEEVARIRDIEAAQRTAKTFVTTIRAEILTIVAGYRLGERGLVTHEQIAQIRKVVGLLEKELDDEQ